MSSKGIWKKELSSVQFKLIIGLLIFVAMAVVIPFLYDQILNIIKNVQVPEMFKNQANMLTNYNYYIWSQWFGKNLFQMGTILAIIFGSGMISSEVSQNTIQFLLVKPILRKKVFLIKYIVNALALASVVIISTLALYISVIIKGGSFPISVLLQNMVMAALGCIVIYSMAVYWSTVFDQPMKAAMVSGLVALIIAIPGFIPGLKMFSVYYHMTGYEILMGKSLSLSVILVFGMISAVIYILGQKRFEGRDF
jgi:ABC-2 type transport system permease protein